VARRLITREHSAIAPVIALAQIAVSAGRPDLNVARMLEAIADARARGAQIIVFSELCVPGYVLGDVWEIDALANDFARWSDDICAASEGLTVIFGNVVTDPHSIGEDGRLRKYNAVLVCHNGQYLARPNLPKGLPDGVQPKALHPNYRFFDDARHFYSLRKLAASLGQPIKHWMVPFEIPLHTGKTFRFGVQLCEDIWCQDYTHEDEVLDGVRMFHAAGAQAVFNLSASPWTWQKGDKRNRTVREVLATSALPFYYVNHVGPQNNGKNILVFDGDSAAYRPDGTVYARADGWREQLLIVPGDLTDNRADDCAGELARASSCTQTDNDTIASASENGGSASIRTNVLDDHNAHLKATHQALLMGLAHLDEIRGTENRFLLGVSGGIDSSLVACLLVQAFGAHRVFAVNMPTKFNSDITQANAQQMCVRLGVDYSQVPIHSLHEAVSEVVRTHQFPHNRGTYAPLVDENIQARIRGADVLAGLAAKHDLIFTNNGNKTEIALGYATLYGDVSGAVAPIGDLYKTQVFDLARYLNEQVFGHEVIPQNLYDGSTVPSAELSAEQDVTKGLGDPIKYGYHDAVLRQLIEYRKHVVDLFDWYLSGELLTRIEWPDAQGFSRYFPSAEHWVNDLEWIERQLRINVFKRIQAPPIIVVSKRAFGFDFRESQLPAYQPRHYDTLRARVTESAIGTLYRAP
jgi:NAD+ synthase (glutamine-hydrolysing)